MSDTPTSITDLLNKYRADLVEATTATENALKQLRQQLTQMERNQIAIAAQKALLDTIERDVTLQGSSTKAHGQE